MIYREYDEKVQEISDSVVDWHDKNERLRYRKEEMALERKFRLALEREYIGVDLPAMPDDLLYRIWSMAWDQGHSHGFSEVENSYQDCAALAVMAFNRGKTAGVENSD